MWKIFNRIARIFRRESTTTPTVRNGGVVLYDSGRSGSDMAVATVYRCVNLLADSVANLPFIYMRKRGDIFVADENSDLFYLLTVQPDTYLSPVDFWRQAVQYILLAGNAYIVPIYNSSYSLERLALCDPGCVVHDVLNDTYTINDSKAGVTGTYDEAEVIHLKNYTIDGKSGISTLAYARISIQIAATGDFETLDRFRNGGQVRGILTNDTSVRGFGEYQDEQLEKAASDIDGQFRTGSHIVAVPGQAKLTTLSLSSTDMQFLETRKWAVKDICRFFGVDPYFAFEDTGSNYKSVEMANVAFLSNTLNPLLRKIEAEFMRKLTPRSLCGKRRFMFDRRQLYSCDLASRVDYQTKTLAAGLYTVNEWRKEENKPAVEGGDTVMMSANLKTIEQMTTEANNTNIGNGEE